MRNLKRALSLALASIMLLGMMVTGAGAASNSFTDFDQIVNQEAAEVTSGLGIFDGYTDGSFGPEKVVTRAEMAVIICKLLNGSDVDPGNFTGISKFTDVPAWAEGYVNYCAAAGIVVGVGEGKFNPSATVTTVEAATMLLKALGYFTEEDKLQADWKTVVTGRATGMHLYGTLTLAVDEGLTRDNVAELVFNTLFAQRVAYDDNRQLYVKNTNRDVVVTNGTQDYLNTFAENTFHMWVVDGLVTANSFTDDDLSETTNNAPRTNVIFDAAAAQDYPATTYQGSTGSEYPFEYTTGLDMIGHSARVYYRMERNAPVVFAIADRATKVEYITYDSNLTNLSDAANAAGFRRNTIREFNSDDYKVNYDWDVTVGTLRRDSSADNDVDLTGSNKWDRNDPAKTLLVISNSTDYAVDCVIVLDQYLDTVKRVVTKNDVTEYDLTTIDGVDQNILHGDAAQGDYVVVTDIGKQGDMLNFTAAEKVSANITKITGKSDNVATVKSIVADGTTYAGSPVYDYRPQNSALDNTTDFEDIATIGEATLLLDFQGKCIGLAQPETMDNYAYAAQFGVWHTGGSLNTEFKLTVKLYFLDGTSGVYLVNTDASQSVNTFYDLKLGKEVDPAEDVRDRLNGGDNNINTDNSQYHVLKTYDAGIHVDGGDLYLKSDKLTNHNDVSGLGIYKVSVRADDTVVMQTLGDDAIGSQIMPIKNTVDGATKLDDETKLVTAHSTFVKQNGQNMTFAENGNVLFQDNKTVYFYVSGDYNDGLTVSAKAGVANAIGITNSSTNSVKDKDNNNEADVFAQILTKGEGGRKNELKRELVEAVMVWGYNTGSNDTLYFYRQNSYDIEHKDNASSRAGEKLYTITYHMFTMDGEPYEAHFNNGGKYYDMETAKETVQNKPTGYYTLGTSDIDEHWYSQGDNTIWYVKSGKVNGEINKVTHVNGVAAGAKNVYVIDATAYHDSYVDNLYTKIEDVGGIIPSTAKVISTVSNCDFDTINEIARACDNGALVKISYCYSTDDYKVKTVFITSYSKEGGNNASSGADLWSEYRSGWLYVFNDKANGENYIDVANSAKAAMEKAGYTVTNLQPYSRDVNNNICWTMEATLNGTKYYFTNGESGLGSGVNGWNYYVKITKETVRVLINGGLDNYYVPQADTFGGSNSSVEAGNLYNVQKKVQGTNNKWEFEQIDSNIAVGASKVIVYSLSGHNIVAGDTVNFVSATNTGKEYNVTGNIGANGTVLIGGEQVGTNPIKVREGSTVTLMVTPNNGYKLDGDVTVTGPNGPVTVSNNTFVMPAGNVTITATFVADKPADTVDVTGKTGEKIDLSSFKAGEEVVFAVEGDGTVAITPNGWYKVEGGSLSDGKNAVRASADGKLVFKFAPTADDIDNGLTITAISKKLTTISGTDLPAEMVVESGQIKLVPYNDLTATVVQSRAAEDPDAPAAFAPGSIIAMDIDGSVFYFVVKTNGDIVLKVTEDETQQVVDAINNAEPNPSTGLVDLNLAVEKETITNTEKFEATAENGKVTEVILPDAQPKAEGALLPKTLVINDVEVEVEWYYNGDKVTETPAYAKAKTGYTYAVKNMQPTEGSDVSFAESVTVKKDVVVDGKVEVVEKPVAVKPGESIDVGVDGTPSIGTGDDTTEGNLTVNFSGAPAGTIVTVNLDGNKATQVKSGEKVTAVTGKDLTLNITVPRGYKVESVTGADKAATEDGGRDLYTISAISDKAAVVNITFTERKVYTLTLSGDKLVKTGNDAGEIYNLTAQGENDEGILFPTGVPAGETPNASGKYVREFKVYEGEFVTLETAKGTNVDTKTVPLDGVAVTLKYSAAPTGRTEADKPGEITFTMPGKNFSLYMQEEGKLSTDSVSTPVEGNMVEVHVDASLTVTGKDSSGKTVKPETINGVDYYPVKTVLTVTGGQWAQFNNDTTVVVNNENDVKKDGATTTVENAMYLKPVAKVTVGSDVNLYNAKDEKLDGVKAVVKGTKVTLKLSKCDAVMVWEVAEGKTAADAPVTAGADGVIVKPAAGSIEYTVEKDVALNAAVAVTVGEGVKATVGTETLKVGATTYMKKGEVLNAESTVAGGAVVGLSAVEAFKEEDQTYKSGPVTGTINLTVGTKVTFSYMKEAYWSKKEAVQDLKVWETDQSKVTKSYYFAPGTWVKVVSGTAAVPVVVEGTKEIGTELENESGAVMFQVNKTAIDVKNNTVEDLPVSIGDTYFIYDKASWMAAWDAGVRGLGKNVKPKGETDAKTTAEAAWEDLDSHGKATFPWLYVEIENPTAEVLNFKTVLKCGGRAVAGAESQEAMIAAIAANEGPQDWTTGTKTNAFIHWEMNHSNDTNVSSFNSGVKAPVGTYIIDITYEGKTLANQKIGEFTLEMVDKMIGASVPTDGDLSSETNNSNVNPEGPQAESVAAAEEKPVQVTADGQNITFENGTLTISKAYDLSADADGSKCFAGLKLGDASGWFDPAQFGECIIVKFTSPIPNGTKQAVKFTGPSEGSVKQDYTDENGVTYYLLGFPKAAQTAETTGSKTIKVEWGDSASELQKPLTITIVDQRAGN